MPIDQQANDNLLNGIIKLAQSGLSGAPVDASKGGISGGLVNTPVSGVPNVIPTKTPFPVRDKYTIPPSDATSTKDGIVSLIPPQYCCTWDEAKRVQVIVGGSEPFAFQPNVKSVTPGTLDRMPYCVNLLSGTKRTFVNCMQVILAITENGIGAPYTVDGDAQIHFTNASPQLPWDTTNPNQPEVARF